MKTALVLFVLCFASVSASRFLTRGLLETESCKNYKGPEELKDDLQIEVSYLRPMPSAEQTEKYDFGVLNHPAGALYGSAVVHLSSPLALTPKLDYFKVSDYPGHLIGLELAYSGCYIILDFIVYSSCDDDCIPGGICVELDNKLFNQDLGTDFPFREGCKGLNVNERPRCMDASLMGMGMGERKDGTAFTDEEVAYLMITFNLPFFTHIEFTPDDFQVSGPPGTEIVSVEAAMPDNPKNVAYIITVKHGFVSSDAEEIKICFEGRHTVRAAGTPYDSDTDICATYVKTVEKPEFLKPSIEIHKSRAPISFC